MNVFILAAGLGTRLKPLTDSMPKALVPVGGVPLLQILIEKLKAAFPENLNVVINIHHFADQIINFVAQNEAFGINIQFSHERDLLLETGGGLKKAAHLFPDTSPILIHNVDILSNIDLREFYDRAVTHGGSLLLVSERKTSRYLLCNSNDMLQGWVNVSTGEQKGPCSPLHIDDYAMYAFSGIHVFDQSLLPMMEKWEDRFSIIDFYLSVCGSMPVRCFNLPSLRLLDVGKLDSLAQADIFRNTTD